MGSMRNETAPWPSGPGLPSNAEIDDNFASYCRQEASEQEGFTAIRRSAVQSPFGPMSSAASLDELSPVTLAQLLSAPVHRPDLLLRLRLVAPAALLAAVITVVEDDTGQRMRLFVYNTPCAARDDARRFLPLGARFALKAPFLKRCADGWLGLRVDYSDALGACISSLD